LATYDFSNLESKFPDVVNQMSDTFDSHEFLLVLARNNQAEYVKALSAYNDSGNPAPFQAVHGAIMHKLKKHSELVKLLRDDKPSKDIFGQSQPCGEWKKIKTVKGVVSKLKTDDGGL